MKPQRKRRMILIVVIVLAVGLATGLATYALRQNINLFYTPSQLLANQAPEGARIRAGGLVVKGSLQRDPKSLAVRFALSDLKQQIIVTYTGILPDLFRAGQGIIATGHYDHGILHADEILAKHDEKYQPPELKGMNLNAPATMPGS